MGDVLTETVQTAVRDSPVDTTPVEERVIAQAVAAKVAADPIAQNALSQEPWFQSRVANYGSLVSIMGVIGLVQQWTAHKFAFDQWDGFRAAQDLAISWGGLMVVYARFVGGLKPMWYRLFGGTK